MDEEIPELQSEDHSILHVVKTHLGKKYDLPFFEDVRSYIRTRSHGDQFIFFVLGLLIVITSLAGFLKLQSMLMVTEPAYGGSLTEGDVGSPRFINPLLALSDTDQDLTSLTYAGLMGLGPNNTLVPVLAQSYIVSPDGKTYQFTLRNNLKFSDGTPLTADDVVYTIQKAQDPALKSPQYSNWIGVQAVALDQHTVQISLPMPYAEFIYNTTLGILPAHLWRNISDDEFPFSPLEIHPIGEGPFVGSQITQDPSGAITSYDLEANPHYATGRPYLDAFHFQFFNDQSALQTAFAKGIIESAYGVSSKNIITAPYSRVFAVFLNPNKNPAFSSLSTRKLLSDTIDRNDIVTRVLGGYAVVIHGPVPPGSGVPDATAVLPTNSPVTSSTKTSVKTQSKNALTTQSAVASSASSTPLTITLATSNVPELSVLAQAIQADWQKAGIQTSIQIYEPGDLSENVIRPRAYQALLFGMVIGKGSDLYDFWSSKEKNAPGLNITGYSNPAVDTLLSKYRTENDPLARTKELTQINQLIAADLPAIFIESPDFVYSVPKDLKGVILSQITAPSDRFATVASWYRRTESVWPFLRRSK